jgi:hypothetical protein
LAFLKVLSHKNYCGLNAYFFLRDSNLEMSECETIQKKCHCFAQSKLYRSMQLHTGAEYFGNAIYRYSELTSQYHSDASIDVNRTWCARDKTIVSQSGKVAEQNNFKRLTVIILTNSKTNKWTNRAHSSTEMTKI